MRSIFLVALLLLAGCGSTQYIMSTNDGLMIPTNGKPTIDEDTGMYVYEDEEGREQFIRKDEVKEIIER